MSRPRKLERKGWPEGLREPRPGYFMFRRADGREVVIGRVSLQRAIEAAEEELFIRQRPLPELSPADFLKMKRTAFSRAKTRARLFGRAVLSAEEFDQIWERAAGRCELTHIPLRPRPAGFAGGVYPWTASVDRIERLKGYEFGNCRIVCAAMNLALNQFGEDVFAEIAHRIYTAG